MNTTLNPNKTRVIRTNSHLFPYGFRQPGCTSPDATKCPIDHKCIDYTEHTSAMDRAQGYAHVYKHHHHPRSTR